MNNKEFAEKLRELAEDGELLWTVPRKAIEDELVDWRDRGLSVLGRHNGFVIHGKHSEDSSIIRFGPEHGVRVALEALADHFEKQ